MKMWFYTKDGQQLGPIPEYHLVKLFRAGELKDDALVWTDGLDQWRPAHEVGGLVASRPTVSLPTAPSAMNDVARVTAADGPLFLHISLGRFVFMSLISLGLYEAYWIYKNWRFLKERDDLSIRPFWRGMLGVFFIHTLLRYMQNDPQTNQLEKATFQANTLATGWVLLMIFSSILGRSNDLIVSLAGVIVGIPTFLFLVPVQNYINRVNGMLHPHPDFSPWSLGHIVCLVVGILLWFLVVVSFMLPV